MREILFKAKRIDNGEWVEGFVFDDGLVNSNRMFVGGLVITEYRGTADDEWNVGSDFYEVIPETICQYTGLTDKNGNKIWENDIIYNPAEDGYFTVDWSDDGGLWEMYNNKTFVTVDFDHHYWSYEVEVVGNIFDNKELIGE